MALIGSAVVLLTWRQGLGVGMVVGGFFAVLGAFILLSTALRVLRGL